MERLKKLCKNSKQLAFSQLLILKKTCESSDIRMIFVHKFLVKFIFDTEKAFLKINPYDGEFFFISKTHNLKIFSSFQSFKKWFELHYLKASEKK